MNSLLKKKTVVTVLILIFISVFSIPILYTATFECSGRVYAGTYFTKLKQILQA